MLINHTCRKHHLESMVLVSCAYKATQKNMICQNNKHLESIELTVVKLQSLENHVIYENRTKITQNHYREN